MRGVDPRLLLDQMEWADAALWRAALATPGVENDQRMRELLHHVAQVQWIYLGLMRGEEPLMRPLEQFADLAAIQAWSRQYHAAAATFFAAQRDPGMLLSFPWADQIEAHLGSARPATLADGLLQVTSHSTYHRGQLNTRIRELGGEPANVDYIVWVWLGRPPAEWTASAAQAANA